MDENNPDIICGCESHLDSQYYTAEVFPSNYTVLRKDTVERRGGVFLCIKEGLNVTEEPELDVNEELNWAKITFAKRNPTYICLFYCPPDLSTEPTKNVLDLVFSTYSSISDISIIPGMSDHEAIVFYVDKTNKITCNKLETKQFYIIKPTLKT